MTTVSFCCQSSWEKAEQSSVQSANRTINFFDYRIDITVVARAKIGSVACAKQLFYSIFFLKLFSKLNFATV